MTRPNDIPQDVWEAAARALIGRDLAPPNDRDRDQICIARAILAERERCATIAEREGVYPELNVYAGGPEWYRHGKRIAAAIRKGGA